jgi:hypothetical protein
VTRRAALALAAGLAAGAAVSASAQVPAGGEFQVNSDTFERQYFRQPTWPVALDREGDFVVVWARLYQFGVPRARSGIFARRFSAEGTPLAPEVRVNASTVPDGHINASVAADGRGNFVVVWSAGTTGQSRSILGQRFRADGSRLGDEFEVAAFSTYVSSSSAVAARPDGGFVVVWSDARPYGVSDVFGRLFDAAGAGGPAFLVDGSTAYWEADPAVAVDATGGFVVVWLDNEGSWYPHVRGRGFAADGTPVGPGFRVSVPFFGAGDPAVASDAYGRFVVVWDELGYFSGPPPRHTEDMVFVQPFDAPGVPRGPTFMVGSAGSWSQSNARVASDAAGNFTVVWNEFDSDGSLNGVFARRYDATAAPREPFFRVNQYVTESQMHPGVAVDAFGNFVVVWQSYLQDGSNWGVFGRRFGGLLPAALAVDAQPSGQSDGNGVLEPGEAAAVTPAWRNVNGAALAFSGSLAAYAGPTSPPGTPAYTILDGTGDYGSAPNGAATSCAAACYAVAVSRPPARPAAHWDSWMVENLAPPSLGHTQEWALHIGESFGDVPRGSPFYPFVETLLHHGVTAGCGPDLYCGGAPVTRQELAVFVLVAREGYAYSPPACATPVFADVPASSPFCPWIEELARRGIVAGCGPGRYCPDHAVSRAEMPVFILATREPASVPPDCAVPVFSDVPAASPFCRWIEDLARRGVVAGCGGGAYCAAEAVTRAQMAVFVGAGFGLRLYGP